MRAGYLGPAGTVSHEALLAAGAGVEPVALPTLRDVVLAVRDGAVERALVPVENAIEGGVDPVLDALALEAPGVGIVGELVHPVSHCLTGPAGLETAAVREVASHPQALAQCARWLAARLPRAAVIASASTADAVRESAASAPAAGRAALGTRLAAERYGAAVLAADVADEPGNATRFAWLAPEGAPPIGDGPRRRTALVFWGTGSGRPGWLVDCLAEFARRGINLTRIESRPLRRGMGEYMFFCDLDGGLETPAVAEAVDALGGHCEAVRVLGSHPAP